MAEHTPTPWEIGTHNLRGILKDAAGIADGCDAYMIAVTSAHSLLSPDEAAANAAFIVKAVNNHEALVAALTLAEDVLSRAPFSTTIWPNGMHPQAGIDRIREALASVVGGVSGD